MFILEIVEKLNVFSLKKKNPVKYPYMVSARERGKKHHKESLKRMFDFK